ncbi:hypothetical protein QBC99_003899 [Beijerinckia sp. GAS462]|nr:hypothetical protein [Beijerinckia sp. GAS462]SED00207.1 hypothetical protein SAMN05443249_4128 [Beijerinckia sp. 28-YEA-48]
MAGEARGSGKSVESDRGIRNIKKMEGGQARPPDSSDYQQP